MSSSLIVGLKGIFIRIRDGFCLMIIFALCLFLILSFLECLAGQFGEVIALISRSIFLLVVAYFFGKMRDE
jgi:hypothetical protein